MQIYVLDICSCLCVIVYVSCFLFILFGWMDLGYNFLCQFSLVLWVELYRIGDYQYSAEYE